MKRLIKLLLRDLTIGELLIICAAGLLILSTTGCATDPAYAQERFDLVLIGIEANKPLACTSTEEVFWVRGGDWEEIMTGNEDGVDWIVVIDSTGKKHVIWSDRANPNCTVKE